MRPPACSLPDLDGGGVLPCCSGPSDLRAACSAFKFGDGNVTFNLLTFAGHGGKLLPQFRLLADLLGHADTLDRGDSALLHVVGFRAEIPRGTFDAPLDVRAAVHPPREASRLQVLVLADLPFLPQGIDQGAVVPGPLLLGVKPVSAHPAQGGLDVRVGVGRVLVGDTGHVAIHLGAHASGDQRALDEVSQHGLLLVPVQAVGQSEFDLPKQLRVLAPLLALHGLPEPLNGRGPLWSRPGMDDLAGDHIGRSGRVVIGRAIDADGPGAAGVGRRRKGVGGCSGGQDRGPGAHRHLAPVERGGSGGWDRDGRHEKPCAGCDRMGESRGSRGLPLARTSKGAKRTGDV